MFVKLEDAIINMEHIVSVLRTDDIRVSYQLTLSDGKATRIPPKDFEIICETLKGKNLLAYREDEEKIGTFVTDEVKLAYREENENN